MDGQLLQVAAGYKHLNNKLTIKHESHICQCDFMVNILF